MAANILHASQSNEWYTPAEYIEAARAVFGGIIWLDPASSEFANEVVRAHHIFTEADNGLAQPWHATSVWCNPPYGKTDGRSNQEVWSEKMLREYRAKHFLGGILLVNAVTDRKWFQKFWEFPICFTNHRIKFYNPAGVGQQPTHGNAFVYMGTYPEWFTNEFRQFGMVVLPQKEAQR